MRKVHFLFLALAAWLVGSTLSSIAEEAIRREPTLARTSAHGRVSVRPAPLDAERLTSLLGLPLASAQTAAAAPAARPTTASPLILLGTLEPSFAAVFDAVDSRMHTVAVGDQLHDDEILAIAHRSITVRHDGQPLELRMQAPPSAPAPSPRAGAKAPTAVSRAELDGALENIPVLASQIQLHPDFTDHQFQGFRVARLQADSLLARAGLRQGDLIRRVNGLDVWRPESLGKLLASAHSVTQVDVELDRDGARLRWSVPLTP
jgi:general secretion pathway protein C